MIAWRLVRSGELVSPHRSNLRIPIRHLSRFGRQLSAQWRMIAWRLVRSGEFVSPPGACGGGGFAICGESGHPADPSTSPSINSGFLRIPRWASLRQCGADSSRFVCVGVRLIVARIRRPSAAAGCVAPWGAGTNRSRAQVDLSPHLPCPFRADRRAPTPALSILDS